jgi:hypothetical protein
MKYPSANGHNTDPGFALVCNPPAHTYAQEAWRMGLKNWYGSQHSGVQAAVVAGMFALVAGIVTGMFAIINTELDKPGSESSVTSGAQQTTSAPGSSSTSPSFLSPPASPSPTSSPTCLAKLHIDKPAEGAVIPNGNRMAPIVGTACDLGSDSGWLFDFDPEDGYYYDDYTGSTPAPAVQPPRSGLWQFPDAPIGSSGDQNNLYTITLVLASPSCDKSLRSEPLIEGNYKIKYFPPGCTVVQKVDVYVTNPQS